MALFRDLIGTIATAEGLSEMTVTGIGQYLRDAGLISKHGRGKAAAQMSVVDAANLLIGVNASNLAKDAVNAVAVYSELEIVRSQKNVIDNWHISSIFEKGTNLRDAIKRVVESFIPDADGLSQFNRDAEDGLYNLEIGFGGPTAAAFISVTEDAPPSISNPFRWLENGNSLAFGHYWNRKSLWSSAIGRKTLSVIDTKTLRAVGKALVS